MGVRAVRWSCAARILLDVVLRPGGRVTIIHMDPNIQGSFLFTNSLNQFPSDLKAPMCQYSVPNSFYKLNPGLNSQLQAGTPHGISDILSRSMVGMGSTGTTTLLSGYSAVGGFGPPVNNAPVYYNRDYNSNLGGFAKPSADCPMKGHSVSCWAESGCDWRGGRQQCTNSESRATPLTGAQLRHGRTLFTRLFKIFIPTEKCLSCQTLFSFVPKSVMFEMKKKINKKYSNTFASCKIRM